MFTKYTMFKLPLTERERGTIRVAAAMLTLSEGRFLAKLAREYIQATNPELLIEQSGASQTATKRAG